VSVDSYFLANTKAAVPWSWLGLDLEGSIFIFAENLTDETYQHRLGYPMPGRMIQIGLDFGF
jgi:outer membrane cobalamin receptor